MATSSIRLKPVWYQAQQGVSMLMFGVVGIMLVGFMAVALYAGFNAYIQTELQQMANGMAGAGARSLYDNFDGSGRPLFSPQQARTATNAVQGRFLAASPVLSAFTGVAVLGITINPGEERVTVDLQKNIPTPLLGPFGINNITIQATGSARYAQMNIPAGLVTINTASGPYTRQINLDPPLLNGPGPDIYINTGISGGGYHGVMVEICSVGVCSDVSRGALVANGNGIVVNRTYNGITYQILYGQFFIDIDAVNINSWRGVAIKITDDGIHDFYNLDGTRGLELVPAPTRPTSLRIMRYAVTCNATGAACNLPGGFVSGATPYG